MNEPSTFNLIDRPWVLVRDREGVTREVSLAGALREADHLIEIVGEVPTQAFATLRLMLAVLHRALEGPADIEDWRAARDDWDSTARRAIAYLERHHDRFDLRHPATPFYQVADLRTSKNEHSGLEKVIADVPNGHPFQYTRIGRGIDRIDWAEAARWLVHVHAFDPSGIRSGAVGDPRVKGGKGYPIGTGWAGSLGGVHIVGRSLASTLMMNLVVPDEVRIVTGEDDLPPWERAPLVAAPDTGDVREPRGVVDAYTWQSRRVRLVGDDDGVVGIVLCQGDVLRGNNRFTVEPMTSWRFSEAQSKKNGATYFPKPHDPSRSAWRGLSALLPQAPGSATTDKPRFKSPAVMQWAQTLVYEGVLTEALVDARAIGVEYGPNSSTYAELIDDCLTLPSALLGPAGGALSVIAIAAVDETEAAVRALRDLAANLARAAGAGRDEVDGPRDKASAQAYELAEPLFRHWLSTLSVAEVDTSPERWRAQARDVIRGVAGQLANAAGPSVVRGRMIDGRLYDLGTIERWFYRRLDEALPRPTTTENGEARE